MIHTCFICLRRLAYAALVMSLTIAGGVSAQELNLFEGVENSDAPDQTQTRSNREERGVVTEPQFTLVGTSRIGNSWKATLRTRTGEAVTVEGTPDGRIPIPGHSGYHLTSVEGRRVAIEYPAAAGCTEFNEKGVNCASENLGSLSLTTAAPVLVANTERNGTENGRNGENRDNQEVQANGSAEDPANPFAAALRAAANQTPEDAANRRAEAQRFQMRRIDPSAVPPGQRLVRTPFGDRLIDE